MIYTGIGSRKTPALILGAMTQYARDLSDYGYTLRSGGAGGADTAFEAGAVEKEIYIPWNGFNGRSTPYSICVGGIPLMNAMELAASFHPAWHKCSPAARKLHARNCFQILGADLDTPTEFVICWTEDGKRGGGTGQALRIASHYKIPIYDLALEADRLNLELRLMAIEEQKLLFAEM